MEGEGSGSVLGQSRHPLLVRVVQCGVMGSSGSGNWGPYIKCQFLQFLLILAGPLGVGFTFHVPSARGARAVALVS